MFLFSFERDAKKHYLLGSYHSFPMKDLPELARDLIKGRQSLVVESFPVREVGDLEEWGLVRSANEDISHINSIFDIILPVENAVTLSDEHKTIIDDKISNFALEAWGVSHGPLMNAR